MNASTKILLLVGLVAAEASVAVAQNSGGDRASRNDRERLICRRMPETGSLIAARRQCFTKAQWDEIANSQQDGADRLINGLRTRPAGE